MTYAEKFDVIVVGGGPAGLSAAAVSARRGAKTLVLEKSREIGYPVKTSGGSFVRDLHALGIPDNLYHPVHRIRLVSGESTAVFEYREPTFCVVDIRGLWQYLAENAAANGASLRCGSKVLAPVVHDGVVQGVKYADPDGHVAKVGAELTIDASGMSAVIARSVGLNAGFRRYGVGSEFEIYAPDFDQDEVVLAYGSEFAPCGYGWAFPRGNARVRVGVGLIHPDTQLDSLERARAFYVRLRERLGLAADWSVLEIHAGVVPSEGVQQQLVKGKVMIAGDSAGHASCLAGEGIRFAIAAGRAAGRAAAAAALGSTTEPLMRYQQDWLAKHGEMYRIAYRMNRALVKLTDSEWDEYVRLASSFTASEFAQILHGDFRRVATRMIRSPRRALKLLRVAREILALAERRDG